MALTATVSKPGAGLNCYVVTISGSSADNSDVSIAGVPQLGRIIRVRQEATTGSCTNHQPGLYEAASGARAIYLAASAAKGTAINDAPTGAAYSLAANTMIFRPGVDGGSDNVVACKVYIVAGWAE